MAGDRPQAWAWISASAFAGALGGLAFPEPPGACFVSAGLVGLAQGALLRRWVEWWSWTLTTMIAGGAAFALARAFADLDAAEIQSGDVVGLVRIGAVTAAGDALIGACQSFLLGSRYRHAAAWFPASAIGAAVFWTAASLFITAAESGEPQSPMLHGALPIAAAMAVSWGGLASGTAVAMRQLRLQKIR